MEHKYKTENKSRLSAESKLKKTSADLETSKKDLARTKTALDASVAKAEELDKRATDLSSELDKTRADRDTAQQKLEQWDLIGLKPGQIKGLIADLENTKKARDAVIAENKIIMAVAQRIAIALGQVFWFRRPGHPARRFARQNPDRRSKIRFRCARHRR